MIPRLLLLATVLSVSPALFAEGSPEIVRRGEAIDPSRPTSSIEAILESPDQNRAPVVIEGVIVRSCTRKGCWMELADAKGERGIRVTFKDYGFFVPLDAKEMHARAEGTVGVRELSKAEVDHLEEEGARIIRRDDGSAFEISFVASGVELWR